MSPNHSLEATRRVMAFSNKHGNPANYHQQSAHDPARCLSSNVRGLMKFIGKIVSVFTIANISDVIVTDCHITGSFNPNSFPVGTEIEIRSSGGKNIRLHIKSAELTLRKGKDYLSFILQERFNTDVMKTFDEVWCDTNLEPIV